MKTSSKAIFYGSVAVLMAACNGDGLFGGRQDIGDGGIDMGVTMQGLLSNQLFCFSWTLFQEDDKGDWKIIDERRDEVCSRAGENTLSDFATCYDGKHFLIQYDVTVRNDKGDILDQATATSGGGPNDVCVKSKDIPSNALIQFNNEGNAGGVNPGIDVEQVCSNNKLQQEGDDLVSALWMQPDSCEGVGTPGSFCMLGCGSGLETARYDFTADGLTRFIFNTAPIGKTWDMVYLPFAAGMDLSVLHLTNSPFALHHSAQGTRFSNEELQNTVGSFRLGSSVGIVLQVGNKLVIRSDQSANCDAEIDKLDAKEQVISLPSCPGGCDSVGVVATGGSKFDIIVSCAGELTSIPCDAKGTERGICSPAQ
jgi:hypothetical protein